MSKNTVGGRYTIQTPLGQGAQGFTWRVTDLVHPERALVLKLAWLHEGRASGVVREFVRHGDQSRLGRIWAERRKAIKASWQEPGSPDLDEALADDFVQRIIRQLDWAGRGKAGARAIEAIRTGWTKGVAAGLVREGQLFAEAVVDPEGGKTGIREFMDKKSPPLPVRRNGVYIDSEHETKGARLEAAGELLPVGAAFFPGVSAIPSHQYAFGIARDADTGAPRFGAPATHERELIVPVPTPEPNEALVYLLTSEVNFNDIWALTGIPVSPFDGHEEDVQITGSGGLALVAALGSEARGQGRLKVGDLVAVYSGTSDLLSPIAGRDPMYADFAIQGYESKTGSHAQFLTVQAPQLHPIPGDLTLEQAGSYILNLGTIVRCLFTTLEIVGGKTIFIEGSATGTGLDALKTAKASGLNDQPTGDLHVLRAQGGHVSRLRAEASCGTPLATRPGATGFPVHHPSRRWS